MWTCHARLTVEVRFLCPITSAVFEASEARAFGGWSWPNVPRMSDPRPTSPADEGRQPESEIGKMRRSLELRVSKFMISGCVRFTIIGLASFLNVWELGDCKQVETGLEANRQISLPEIQSLNTHCLYGFMSFLTLTDLFLQSPTRINSSRVHPPGAASPVCAVAPLPEPESGEYLQVASARLVCACARLYAFVHVHICL